MRTGRGPAAAGRVGALFDVGTMAGLSDSLLLDRFTTRDGEAAELAFAALVERHGPMVLRVCRGVLRDRDAAHDALQATLLVLATKPGSLRRRASLASWLHGVALRVARCARSAEARRRRHERRKAAEAPAMALDPVPNEEHGAIVHEELARLAERYRSPIVLCDLDDLTHEAAASRLGLPVGTVKSRLARGRAILRDRLARRGLAPTAAVPLVTFGPVVRDLPPALVDGLARSAAKLAAGAAMAGVVPASTSALVQGVQRMMHTDAMRRGALAGFGLIGIAAGLALAARPADPPRPAPPPTEERQVSHEVRYCDMGARGTAWREAFAADAGFRPLESVPAGSAWALDAWAVRRFLEHCQSQTDANVVQAPKVTAFDGSKVTIVNATEHVLTDDVARKEPGGRLTNVYSTPAAGPVPDRSPGLTSLVPRPGSGTLPEGLLVQATGKVAGGKVAMKVEVETAHVVAIHDALVPGSAAGPSRNGEPPRVKTARIPEVERSRVQGDWTVDDGETILLSLGVVRSIDGRGKASTREMLVLVTPRIIVLESEEVRLGAPPTPGQPLSPRPHPPIGPALQPGSSR